jgi:hypothetical protein
MPTTGLTAGLYQMVLSARLTVVRRDAQPPKASFATFWLRVAENLQEPRESLAQKCWN